MRIGVKQLLQLLYIFLRMAWMVLMRAKKSVCMAKSIGDGKLTTARGIMALPLPIQIAGTELTGTELSRVIIIEQN